MKISTCLALKANTRATGKSVTQNAGSEKNRARVVTPVVTNARECIAGNHVILAGSSITTETAGKESCEQTQSHLLQSLHMVYPARQSLGSKQCS